MSETERPIETIKIDSRASLLPSLSAGFSYGSTVGFVALLVAYIGLNTGLVPAVGAAIIFTVVGGVAIGILARNQYKDISYKFYDDRIEFEEMEGLWGREVESLPYDKVTGVEYEQSPLERLFNVGTVSVNTSGGDEDMEYISNPEEVYQKTRRIINEREA